MAYSNPTAWMVDGVSLQTLAQNIETTTGLAPPPARGDDLTIPFRQGQIFQPKIPDARVIEFQMWVKGSTSTGAEPTGKSKREQFYDNWIALRNLLWRPGEQFILTKRFPRNGGIKVVEARGSFDSGLEPAMHGPHAAKFTFNVKLTDPFFYDTDWTQINLANGNNGVAPEGDVETKMIQFRINAQRTNTKIFCGETAIGLNFNTSVNSGAATIDAYGYDSNINGARSNGAVTHYGSPAWFRLKRGTQNVQLGSDSGNGLVSLFYKNAWI